MFMITFAHPHYLFFGGLSCVSLWLLWRHQDRIRLRNLHRFAAAPLLPALTATVSEPKRALKKVLVLGAVFLCFSALARPRYGYRWLDVRQKGIDILFALDTSGSMRAEDIRPSRLERGKLAIMDFVAKLEGDRVGLLPFAGTSYVMCPLTSDYHAFEQSLRAVTTGLIPLGGTNIGSAISSAEKQLANEANHKILVLVSDGENLEDDVVPLATQAHENGLTIFTVGIGTAAGELIPDLKSGGFVKDQDGSYVKSRLDEKTLQRIADSGGGIYAPLGNNGQGLETIYREKLAMIPKVELAEQRKKVPIERFEWPLALALVLLGIEYLLSERKSKGALTGLRKTFTYSLATALCLSLLTAPAPGHASEAEKEYARGEYSKADMFYQKMLEKEPDNAQILYNKGTTAYKTKHFSEAIQAFNRALHTDDVALQEKAYFNRGNALYRQGEAALPDDPKQTGDMWEHALKSFEHALALNPENRRARTNHEFVGNKLAQLRQQTRQQADGSTGDRDRQNDRTHHTDDPFVDHDQKKQHDPKNGGDQAEQQPPAQKDNSTTGTPDTKREKQKQSEGDDEASPAPGGHDKADQSDDAQSGETNSDHPGSTAKTIHEQDPSSRTRSESLNMTKEEAEQLLRAIETDMGRLDLIAPPADNHEEKLRKNW